MKYGEFDDITPSHYGHMNVPSKPQQKDSPQEHTGKVGRIKKEGCDTAAGGVPRCPT